MSRQLSLVASLLALGLALLALVRSQSTSRHVRAAEERHAQLAADLAAHAAGLHAGRDSPSERALSTLEARIADLERVPRRSPAEAVAPVSASASVEAPVREEDRHRASSAARAELADLLAHLVGADHDLHGSDEDVQRFYELARQDGLLAQILDELEQRVAAHPNDLDARMELASAYVAKIRTMPGGPEQGVWGSKAETQWRAVTAQDPEHWGAHFALGNNYSFYPDVMGKTGEAIRYLERARAIQERGAPSSEHVQIYLSLARLYVRDGRRDDARAVLEAGLRVHAGNETLQAELERLTGT